MKNESSAPYKHLLVPCIWSDLVAMTTAGSWASWTSAVWLRCILAVFVTFIWNYFLGYVRCFLFRAPLINLFPLCIKLSLLLRDNDGTACLVNDGKFSVLRIGKLYYAVCVMDNLCYNLFFFFFISSRFCSALLRGVWRGKWLELIKTSALTSVSTDS